MNPAGLNAAGAAIREAINLIRRRRALLPFPANASCGYATVRSPAWRNPASIDKNACIDVRNVHMRKRPQ
jgi:hypothetical protein